MPADNCNVTSDVIAESKGIDASSNVSGNDATEKEWVQRDLTDDVNDANDNNDDEDALRFMPNANQ